MFKVSDVPGSQRSVELHEALAFSVLKKDSNMVFRSESIDAIISYKWEKLQWYFYLQFLLRIAYVLSIFHTRNVYVVMSWSIWHSLLILN
jgi:hypothetical protein